MLKEITEAFLSDQKLSWIKKKTKSKDIKEEKLIVLKNEADERYNFKDWLAKAVKNARPSITSHPSTFTHSDAKTTALRIVVKSEADGLLRTGNAKLIQEFDVFGNAATDSVVWDIYLFLNTKASDGKSIFDHFKEESQASKNLIHPLGLEYTEVRTKFISMFEEPQSYKTSPLLKQVYFPVNGNYHLLSLLSSSAMIYEMKRRIDSSQFSESTKNARSKHKANECDENGYDEYLNLIMMGFGGKKPQNVSVLNSQNYGRIYLMPSAPPIFKQREVRLPAKNFFKNSLSFKQFKESFQSLHILMKCEISNKTIRDGIGNILKFVIDQVLQKVLKVRQFEAGWSKSKYYQSLPLAQKIWLDEINQEQRDDNEVWLNEVVKSFSRWMIQSYETVLKNMGIKMGDDEFRHISDLIEAALLEDKEFLK